MSFRFLAEMWYIYIVKNILEDITLKLLTVGRGKVMPVLNKGLHRVFSFEQESSQSV